MIASTLRRLPRGLVVVSAVMLVVRVAFVLRYRDVDSDAYGHYFIALATRRTPASLNVHWVWLPLFHFLVAPFTQVGLTFRGVRLVNAILATLPPLLVWDIGRRRDEETAPWAALSFAVSPLLTLLGQSAQPEMLFLVLVTLTMFAAAREQPAWAGTWLALASLVRYEAWGGACAMGVWWLWKERSRRWLPFVLVPGGTIAFYILLRWWVDGAPLVFIRGTHAIAKTQTGREVWSLYAIFDFPVIMPWRFLGLPLLALPFGVRSLPVRDRFLAVGIIAFLLVSYYTSGSHAAERYLLSLTPFAWLAIADASRWIRRRELMVALVGFLTIWHLHRTARMANQWEDELREREQTLEEDRRRP